MTAPKRQKQLFRSSSLLIFLELIAIESCKTAVIRRISSYFAQVEQTWKAKPFSSLSAVTGVVVQIRREMLEEGGSVWGALNV